MIRSPSPVARAVSGRREGIPVRNLKLVVAYEGTRFKGWQAQRGLRTAQGELYTALEAVLGNLPQVNAAGRTDAGVHAEGQVVNFRTEDRREPEVLRRALNELLPADMTVRKAEVVPINFHARHSPLSRTYRFQVVTEYNPFLRRHTWRPEMPLDPDRLAALGETLVGRHDFRSFCDGKERGEVPKSGSVCTVLQSEWTEAGAGLYYYHITADHFLWKMVRRLVGTMVVVASRRLDERLWRSWLTNLSRESARYTAPPFGLFLESVQYE